MTQNQPARLSNKGFPVEIEQAQEISTFKKTCEKIRGSPQIRAPHLSSNAALDVKLVLSFALKGASRRQPSHLRGALKMRLLVEKMIDYSYIM